MEMGTEDISPDAESMVNVILSPHESDEVPF